MSKETGVIILGFLVAILPFLGFPESWRVFFFVLLGAGIATLGFVMRAHMLGVRSEEESTFVEHNPRNMNDIYRTHDRENQD